MGEAIARFREMALAMRRASDAAFMQTPQVVFYCMPPTEGASIEADLRSGDIQPREFARLLRSAVRDGRTWQDKDAAALHGKDRRDWCLSLGGKREAILARAPSAASLRRLHAAALDEASAWGDRVFASIESGLASLSDATLAMRATAADAWVCRHSQGKVEYAKQLMLWQKHFDALALFISAPPAAASSSPKAKAKQSKKKPRSRKGIGGPSQLKYSEELVRDVLTRYEREKNACRKSKDRLPSKSEWLRLYCLNRKIDIDVTFPSKNKERPEPWDKRANNFWKAAEARVRRAGN